MGPQNGAPLPRSGGCGYVIVVFSPKFLTAQNGVELGSLMIFDRAVRGRFGLLLGPKAPFWGHLDHILPPLKAQF